MKKSFQRAQQRREDGRAFRHDLGQHFLRDERLLHELAEAIELEPDEAVLEIGPGDGALTRELCAAARTVAAVEADESLLPFLRVLAEQAGNLRIIPGDIRKQDLSALCASLGEKVVVAGNLPYSITTPILQLFWERRLPVRRMAFMVQKEVAQKLVAQPGDPGYCLASLRCRYCCEPRVAREVPAGAFTPPPKVDSAFVLLPFREERPLSEADEPLLWRLATAGFALRRKTLTNALKGVWPQAAPALADALRDMGLSPSVRGEALTLAQWVRLTDIARAN